MSLNAGGMPLYSYNSKRGNHPCLHKGLPSTGIPTFKLNGQDVSRWFYCKNNNGEFIEDKDRLDSALKPTLSSNMINGNMPAEWYKERMKKAYGGVLIIHVNSDVASQM
jgi:hypothetical protein